MSNFNLSHGIPWVAEMLHLGMKVRLVMLVIASDVLTNHRGLRTGRIGDGCLRRIHSLDPLASEGLKIRV